MLDELRGVRERCRLGVADRAVSDERAACLRWGKICEAKNMKNPFQRGKVGQPREFIRATSFFPQVQRG